MSKFQTHFVVKITFSNDEFLLKVSEDFEYEENDELYTPDDESSGRKIGNRPTKPNKDTPWKATTMTGNQWIGKLT